MTEHTQIAVVGAGLSGLLSALALSDSDYGPGCQVVLVDAGVLEASADNVTDGARVGDGRASALIPSALRLFQRLDVGPIDATAMTGMRVGEGEADTPWQFELPERDGAPLAQVVENAALRAALMDRLRDSPVKIRDGVRVEGLSQNGRAVLSLSDGASLQAEMVVAADGRASALRRLAGMSVSRTEFGQSALVTTVTHAEPHEGIALQRFQRVGAVASLPLATTAAGHRSQIVWSDRHAAVAAACALPDEARVALIDERLWGALAVTGLDATSGQDTVQSYPLVAQRSEALSRGRVVLVGDAARTIHPLAGQGFNLAVRDVAALVDGVIDAVRTGQDIGQAGLLGYERWRRADETLLAGVTTALARAPARGPLAWIGHARRAAFATVDELPWLHPLIRQEAAGESGDRPTLLR